MKTTPDPKKRGHSDRHQIYKTTITIAAVQFVARDSKENTLLTLSPLRKLWNSHFWRPRDLQKRRRENMSNNLNFTTPFFRVVQ